MKFVSSSLLVAAVCAVVSMGRVASAETEDSSSSSWSWFGSSSSSAVSTASASPATAQRFAKAFPKDTQAKLSAYLTWKQVHHVQSSAGQNDAAFWKKCMAEAFEFHQTKPTPGNLRGTPATAMRTSTTTSTDAVPPADQPIFDPQVTDLDGRPIFQLLAPRMDLSIPHAKEIYVDAIAAYFEGKFMEKGHDSSSKVTLLVDIRAGRGWANPQMRDVKSFYAAMANSLAALHPDRVEKIIVYPLPKAALGIYSLVKPFLGKSITDHLVLLSGAAGRHSPVPKDQLEVHVGTKAIDFMEKRRLRLFSRR